MAALLLTVLGGVAGCGGRPQAAGPIGASGAVGSLVITRGGIAEPIGTSPAVLYFTLTNRGARSDALVAVTVAGTDRSDIHRTVTRAGLAWMEPAPQIAIPAGATVDFVPGGNHIMVQGGAEHLRRGARVEVRLVFRRAGSLRITVPVLAYRELDRLLLAGGSRPGGSGPD
jgi:copper(I)-binding protein